MHTFGGHTKLDKLNYGNTAQKHIDTVNAQSKDMSTVLGVYLSLSNRPCPLPPPPPNGGVETILEMNHIVDVQNRSTEDERKYAVRMDNLKNHYEMWARETNIITGQKYTNDFFNEIAECTDGYLNYMKMKYDRPRPYQLAPIMNKRIERIIPDPMTSAYPSGHSMDAWVFAFILSKQYPVHQHEFYTIAQKIGQSRVVAGVHFPSDLSAGKMLAESALNIIQDHKLLKGII